MSSNSSRRRSNRARTPFLRSVSSTSAPASQCGCGDHRQTRRYGARRHGGDVRANRATVLDRGLVSTASRRPWSWPADGGASRRAKVQGETGTDRELSSSSRPYHEPCRPHRPPTLAAILAAGAGSYWAGQRDVALPPHSLGFRAIPLARKETHTVPASARPVPSGTGDLLPRSGWTFRLFGRSPRRHRTPGFPRRPRERRTSASMTKKKIVDAEISRLQLPRQAGPPKKIIRYRNPMGLPGHVSHGPEEVTLMGMDYLPRLRR